VLSPPFGLLTRRLGAAVLLALACADPATAQGTGQGFLFGAPSGAFAVRGGFDRARADSDVFAFVIDELTVDKSDFRGATIGADVSFIVAPRVAISAGFTIVRTKTPSEFRHWEDNQDLPIEQVTTLRRVPVSGSLKIWLTSPGRAIGRRAWVPARFAPYVGAGAGAMHYNFAQEGDFIDFDTTVVFRDLFESSGWTPAAHGFAGLDISLTPRLVFSAEGRYEWARSDLGADFAGFAPIDLSAFKMLAGFSIRY